MRNQEDRLRWLRRNLAFDRRMWHTFSRHEGEWYAIPWRLGWLIQFYVRGLVRGAQ